jgi:hypothetical protein
MTAAARLKVLQKTPLPMVIARMKVSSSMQQTCKHAAVAPALLSSCCKCDAFLRKICTRQAPGLLQSKSR